MRGPDFDTVRKLFHELADLGGRFSTCANVFRAGIVEAEEPGNAVTADPLTESLHPHDKDLWFLEAHQPDSN